jgi:hypothetical protein
MIPAILTELPTLFGAVNLPSIQNGPDPGDVFELYVFGLILEAARREQATVTYENVNGPFQGVATFRTTPGRIWSQSDSYTHAVLQFPHRPTLEVHLGIYLEGKSSRVHESDVVVLPRSEALSCRTDEVHPKFNRSLCAVECKFYDQPLGINLGRSFIGLSAEFGTERAFFVMNQSEGTIGRLLDEHKRKWEHSIVPPSINNVSRFIGSVQTVFKSYKVGK